MYVVLSFRLDFHTQTYFRPKKIEISHFTGGNARNFFFSTFLELFLQYAVIDFTLVLFQVPPRGPGGLKPNQKFHPLNTKIIGVGRGGPKTYI